MPLAYKEIGEEKLHKMIDIFYDYVKMTTGLIIFSPRILPKLLINRNCFKHSSSADRIYIMNNTAIRCSGRGICLLKSHLQLVKPGLKI